MSNDSSNMYFPELTMLIYMELQSIQAYFPENYDRSAHSVVHIPEKWDSALHINSFFTGLKPHCYLACLPLPLFCLVQPRSQLWDGCGLQINRNWKLSVQR